MPHCDASPPTTRFARALMVGALLLGVGATSLPASAQGVRSMQDSPLAKFSDEDIQLMNGAVQHALDSGEKTQWKNDETGSRGTATPSAGSREDCKVLVVENQHKSQVGVTKYQFCKVGGAWKAVS
jgi:hypothetical protein